MATFPDIPPDYGSGENLTQRMIEHGFGDGYTETAPDGINYNVREWNMKWNAISVADHDTIMDFLKDNPQSFYFTPPRSTEQVRVKLQGKVNSAEAGYDAKNISFKLKEVFIP